MGLVVYRAFPGPNSAWQGMLAGMLPRMAIPLGFAIPLHIHGGPLAEAGLLVYLVVFYPVTLAAETALCLPRRRVPR